MENSFNNEEFGKDTFQTSEGNLIITFVGHATLVFEFGNQVIHIDPVQQEADYSVMPKADIVLVTHQHSDHFDLAAIRHITKENTTLICTEKCNQNSENLPGPRIMHNGDTLTVNGIHIEAVPAYNIVHMRSAGNPFHPKGEGNGYIMTFGDKRVYIAGDTENIPEMKTLDKIDIAFLPMNLPYTMTPEMVADAAQKFNPKILYPYHFGDTDTQKIVQLLKHPGIEVRIRKMK